MEQRQQQQLWENQGGWAGSILSHLGAVTEKLLDLKEPSSGAGHEEGSRLQLACLDSFPKYPPTWAYVGKKPSFLELSSLHDLIALSESGKLTSCKSKEEIHGTWVQKTSASLSPSHKRMKERWLPGFAPQDLDWRLLW
ncbi:hypothetical protein JRQ81_011269 [Phrynocephalus forsythii]|uniref:Uncharacterized protein n=1 Tax=Phrynocephalus forsythii TaxID=171643 RepID=A0A9Q1AQX8_9SAUR|nr:hypothetical protein JRQ81_011269 [Phrynocephalus forsythii]